MADEKEVPVKQGPGGAGLADTFRTLEIRDKITVAGTGLVFILGFLPWYTFESPVVSSTTRGFGPWYGKLCLLSCLAIMGLIMLPALRKRFLDKLGQDARALSVPVLTAAALIIGPVFFLIDTGGSLVSTSLEMSEGRTLWFYLALLSAIAAAAGAWTKWKIWFDQI